MAFKQIISWFLIAFNFLGSLVSFPTSIVNFRIDVSPCVFETGDDMYTVMWTTNKSSSGYVTYSYEGKEYKVTDQVNGNIRSSDTIHSVRVPKKHLDNNEYVCSSEYVGIKLGYVAIKGKTVSTDPISFAGYNGEKRINVLVLSDIHNEPENAKKAMAHFTEKPEMIVLNGDIMSEIDFKNDFCILLSYAADFSNGEIPVAYVRGNHEPRGGFASEIGQYFKTTSGGMYYTFTYGPIWNIALDSGEDKEDSHKEYSGLVDFTAYTAQETTWLSNIDSEAGKEYAYRICYVHQPDIDDVYGADWIPMLENLDIQAAVSGHYHQLIPDFHPGSASFFRIVEGGKSAENTYIATMLTFEDGNMFMESYDVSGQKLCDKTFSMKKFN